MSGVVEDVKEEAKKFVAQPLKGIANVATAVAQPIAGGLNFVRNNSGKIADTVERITPGPARKLVKNTFGADIRNSGRAFQSIVDGDLGGAVKPYAERVKSLGASAGLLKGQDTPLPSVAPRDPAAVAEEDRQAKLAAKRKAKVDLMTDRPGRGGILA